jgi:hypothetical protein
MANIHESYVSLPIPGKEIAIIPAKSARRCFMAHTYEGYPMLAGKVLTFASTLDPGLFAGLLGRLRQHEMEKALLAQQRERAAEAIAAN